MYEYQIILTPYLWGGYDSPVFADENTEKLNDRYGAHTCGPWQDQQATQTCALSVTQAELSDSLVLDGSQHHLCHLCQPLWLE